MPGAFTAKGVVPIREVAGGLLQALAKRVPLGQLSAESGVAEEKLREWMGRVPGDAEAGAIVRLCQKLGEFALLSEHGITPVSYDLRGEFDLTSPPVGYDWIPPRESLLRKPTEIAGFKVDYPLGLPASVLAANAKWIEFYANRGFDILTYKTVRSVTHSEHPWPNWVFLKGSPVFDPLPEKGRRRVTGGADYWPVDDPADVSMANSFGIPSFAPEWWQDDVARARDVIHRGQVLIVSVVATDASSEDAMKDDFVRTARLAKEAGAQVVEANFSCPNVTGEERELGEVCENAERAGRIAKALKGALQDTPLFLKIGYLEKPNLMQFLDRTHEYIRGITAINTISAEVVDEKGNHVFPGRKQAGVSGRAIRERSKEVLHNLVQWRNKLDGTHSNFTILSVGGVGTKEDVDGRLALLGQTGGVEICTAAFYDPDIGLKIRGAITPRTKRPSRVATEFKFLGKFIEDTFLHPSRASVVKVHSRTGQVFVRHK